MNTFPSRGVVIDAREGSVSSARRSATLGLLFAATTALLWGAVPLAMAPLVAHVDAATISWFRFAVAGALLGAFFAASGRLRLPRARWRGVAAPFVLAVAGLVGNSVFYVQSLHFIAAPVAQTVVQVAPVLLMLGSLWLFGERFAALQWGGFVLLVGGIAAFCVDRLQVAGVAVGVFGTGVALMLVAALAWTVYGLAQKRLLLQVPAQLVLMGIYLASAVLLLPASSPGVVATLGGDELLLLAFLALNTLIAYGAFAEALKHWDAARVGAVLALQPIVTLAGEAVAGRVLPAWFEPARLTAFAVVACLAVVAGSAICALGGAPGAKRLEPLAGDG